MTDALLMLVTAIGSYSAGICTMSILQIRRIKLVEPIGADLGRRAADCAADAPNRASGPARAAAARSPYAPRPKPPGPPQKPARRRQIHWPIARAEPEKPPAMVKIEPRLTSYRVGQMRRADDGIRIRASSVEIPCRRLNVSRQDKAAAIERTSRKSERFVRARSIAFKKAAEVIRNVSPEAIGSASAARSMPDRYRHVPACRKLRTVFASEADWQ